MKLLLVEDEAKMARALASAASARRATRSTCAPAARDALEQGQAVAYDVMLLDWSLPDLDGVSVLRAGATPGCAPRC